MSKERNVSFDEVPPVPIDDIDGGTFGILQMDYDTAELYGAACAKTEIERDEQGQIVYTQQGSPVRRLVQNTAAEIAVAASRVAYVHHLKVNGKLVELERGDPRIVPIIKLLGTSEVPLDTNGAEFIGAAGQVRATAIPLNEKKEPRVPNSRVREDGIVVAVVNEARWRWIVRESSRLRREHDELLLKNS